MGRGTGRRDGAMEGEERIGWGQAGRRVEQKGGVKEGSDG